MSFSSDVKQIVRDELSAMSEDIKNPDAADLIYRTEGNLTSDALARAVEPVIALNERRAERISTERYDELVEELGSLVAEAIAFEALQADRRLRDVSKELEDILKRSAAKFGDICKEYEDSDDRGGGRRRDRRDRDEDSEVSRRGSNRRKKGDRRGDKDQRRGGRHVNSYERDEEPDSRS